MDYRLGGLTRSKTRSPTCARRWPSFAAARAEFGIDANQLVLLGEDSGAQLAALLAAERPPGVIGAVLIGGFYDLGAIPSLSREHPTVTSSAARVADHARRAADAAAARRAWRRRQRVAGRAGAPLLHQRRTRRRPCQFLEVAGASHRSENWLPSQWSYKRDDGRAGSLTSLRCRRSQRIDRCAARRSEGHRLQPRPRSAQARRVPAARSAKPVPAVIVVHGGGWEAGDKVTYVTPLFEPLARAGLAWFSIDYRLTPAFTNQDQLEDVRAGDPLRARRARALQHRSGAHLPRSASRRAGRW